MLIWSLLKPDWDLLFRQTLEIPSDSMHANESMPRAYRLIESILETQSLLELVQLPSS